MAILIQGHQLNNHPALRDAMYTLRHKAFYEELRWDVNSIDGKEFDEFDRDDTVYIVHQEEGQIIGCCRLLPTTKPYMLSEVFHDFAEGYIPKSAHIWEVSRYVVDKKLIKSAKHWDHVSSHMLCTLCEFAMVQGIRELAIVMHPSLVDKAMPLYGVPHKKCAARKFGETEAQVCHYWPSFIDQHRQASAMAGIRLPATPIYDISQSDNVAVMAAE